MLKPIKDFWHRMKIRAEEDIHDDTEPPVTHTKVFYKEYPRLPSVPLFPYDQESAFQNLLEMRESQRLFSDEPISLADVSKILQSCRVVNPTRNPEMRTYPSGGARFPVELYLVSFNVQGLDQGAYHYNIPKGCLEQLIKQNLVAKRRALISPYLENPAATIIFTSVIARSEVKYGQRAYPYSLIEAGHMGQNIQLTCAEIGLGACPVSGFVDDSAIKMLDLTSDEIPIYSMSIGKPTR